MGVKPCIIGLLGNRGSGREAVADCLEVAHGYQVCRWADALLSECRGAQITYMEDRYTAVLRIHREDMFTRGVDDRRDRLIDAAGTWIKGRVRPIRLAQEHQLVWQFHGMQKRDEDLLRWWDAEFRRAICGEDYWISQLEDTFRCALEQRGPDVLFVVPDTSSMDEVAWIRSHGGVVWRVGRGDQVEELCIEDDDSWDAILDNSGDRDGLYRQIENCLRAGAASAPTQSKEMT